MPAPPGKWGPGRGERPAAAAVVETIELLRRDYPRYVWTDPASNLDLPVRAPGCVARYYRPEAREIMAGPAAAEWSAAGQGFTVHS